MLFRSHRWTGARSKRNGTIPRDRSLILRYRTHKEIARHKKLSSAWWQFFCFMRRPVYKVRLLAPGSLPLKRRTGRAGIKSPMPDMLRRRSRCRFGLFRLDKNQCIPWKMLTLISIDVTIFLSCNAWDGFGSHAGSLTGAGRNRPV